MLHHVSIEIHPEDVGRTMEFLRLIGFAQIEAPAAIADHVYWVEARTAGPQGGPPETATQIHLIKTTEPATQHLGHPAFVTPDFEETIGKVRDAGFQFEESQELWGERRGFATLPGGQKVELMAAPPRTVN